MKNENGAVTTQRALRAKELAETFGIGLSSVWRHVQEDPEFPRPIKLTPRCTVFDAAEAEAWYEARKAARRRI
jgi:prophage regulatory protein